MIAKGTNVEIVYHYRMFNFPAIFEIVNRIYQISRDILESSNDLDTKQLPKSAFTRLSYLTKVRIHLCNQKIITVSLNDK